MLNGFGFMTERDVKVWIDAFAFMQNGLAEKPLKP
jgi:hypothetical protein